MVLAAERVEQRVRRPSDLDVAMPSMTARSGRAKLRFDGCRTTDGTLLEAKGPGIAQHISDGGEWKPYIIDSGKADLDKQLIRQSIAAGDRMIEWHVAEPPLASYIRNSVRDNGISNIAVFDAPPRMP